MKKNVIFLIGIIFLSSLVLAQDYKMEITTIPEDKIFEAGSAIQLKITIRDESNNLINDVVTIILEDLKENQIIEKTIQSNILETINLPEGILSGQGEIIVKFRNTEITKSFFISENKLVKFELIGEKLKVTNMGNTKYQEKIYITIGDTTGTKTPKLNVGESISYRLIAPKGVYNIRVTDGQTTLTRGEISLTGTGKVIGAIDESAQVSGITGNIGPENTDGEDFNYLKGSKFVYVFVLTVFGAMILLAVERQYRKKVEA